MTGFKVLIKPADNRIDLDRVAYDTLDKDCMEYHAVMHRFKLFNLILITYKKEENKVL